MKYYILPGMGAKKGMYPDPWKSLGDVTFLDWPEHQGETRLEEVARRMVTESGMEKGSVVIGSSLGGMVGCEISRLVSLHSLYLMGSAERRDEINGFLSIIHPWVDLVPLELAQRLIGKFPGDLGDVFTIEDASFIRSMVRGIFLWEGLKQRNCPVYRLHGKYDLVILPPKKYDLLLPAGHLIAMSHPDDCIRFIQQTLKKS